MANQVFGDLETFESSNTATYGFGTIKSNRNIEIRGTGSVSTTTTLSSNQTTDKHILLPSFSATSDVLVTGTSSDTFLNKTITDVSNIVHCDAFKTAGGAVIISGATPTGAGQVLVTTGSDTAIWATPGSTTASDALPLAGGTMLGPINMDDNRILNIPDVPIASDDAVNKTFVLGSIPFSDIAQNTSDIVALQSDVVALQSDSVGYSSDIVALQSDSVGYSSDIAQLFSDTAQNTSDIAGFVFPTYVNWTDWTPAAGTGLKAPFTINAAKYSRIGNIVNILLDVLVTKDITSDTIIMTGLPINIGTFGTGNKIANSVYIIDVSDDTFTPARFVLDQTSPTSITVELADFQDSHGYLIQGQFVYSA